MFSELRTDSQVLYWISNKRSQYIKKLHNFIGSILSIKLLTVNKEKYNQLQKAKKKLYG